MKRWTYCILFWLLPAHAQLCGDPNSMLTSVEDILAVGQCLQPTIAGSGVRYDRAAGRGVPNSARYVLRRSSATQWEVELNVELTNHSALKDHQAAPRMRKRIDGCFREAAPYMRGPSGQSLRMRLYDPKEPAVDGLVPPLIPITLLTPGKRGDAENFAVDFDCGTIIHEFMHHLGLCDEYRETGDFGSSGACRVVVPFGSLMGQDMSEVYDSTVGAALECNLSGYPRWRDLPREQLMLLFRIGFDNIMFEEPFSKYSKHHCSFAVEAGITLTPAAPGRVDAVPRGFTVTYLDADLGINSGRPRQIRQVCQCPRGATDCATAMEVFRLRAAHLYSAEGALNRCPKNVIPRPVFRESGESAGITFAGDVARVVNQKSGRGLLHPAHFERIIRGACTAHDQQTPYDKCAIFAYQWSEPLPRTNGCQAVPAVCRDPVRMLGVPPRVP